MGASDDEDVAAADLVSHALTSIRRIPGQQHPEVVADLIAQQPERGGAAARRPGVSSPHRDRPRSPAGRCPQAKDGSPAAPLARPRASPTTRTAPAARTSGPACASTLRRRSAPGLSSGGDPLTRPSVSPCDRRQPYPVSVVLAPNRRRMAVGQSRVTDHSSDSTRLARKLRRCQPVSR